MSPKILIADDHEIVREGIRTLIRRSRPDWIIAGEATDGKQAVTSVKTLQPDIVILDITMPVLNGLGAANEIAKLKLPTRVLMFTMHDVSRLAEEARNAGAHGYVVKSQASRDLIRAIDQLLSGGTFFGQGVSATPTGMEGASAGEGGSGEGPASSEPKKRERVGLGFILPRSGLAFAW
jgi:DNA-binding NarL/FixJ family response regulator